MSDYINKTDELTSAQLNLIGNNIKNIVGEFLGEETLLRGIYKLMDEKPRFYIEPDGGINSNGLNLIITRTTNVPNVGWTKIDGQAYPVDGDFGLFVKEDGEWVVKNTKYEQIPDDGFKNLATVELIDDAHNFIGTNSSFIGDEHHYVKYSGDMDIILMSLFKPEIGHSGRNTYIVIEPKSMKIYRLNTEFMEATHNDIFGDNVSTYVTINSNNRIIAIDKSININDVVALKGKMYGSSGDLTFLMADKEDLEIDLSHFDKIVGNNVEVTNNKGVTILDSSGGYGNSFYYVKNGTNEVQTYFENGYNTLNKTRIKINGSDKDFYYYGNRTEFKNFYSSLVGLPITIIPREVYRLSLNLNKYKQGTPLVIEDAPVNANDVINLAFALTMEPASVGGNTDEYNGYTYYDLSFNYYALQGMFPDNYETRVPHTIYSSATSNYNIKTRIPYSDTQTDGLYFDKDMDRLITKAYDRNGSLMYSYTYKPVSKSSTDSGLLYNAYKNHFVEINAFKSDKRRRLLRTNGNLPIYVGGGYPRSPYGDCNNVVMPEGIYTVQSSTGEIVEFLNERIVNYSIGDRRCLVLTCKGLLMVSETVKRLHLHGMMVDDLAITFHGYFAILTNSTMRVYSRDTVLVSVINNVSSLTSAPRGFMYTLTTTYEVYTYDLNNNQYGAGWSNGTGVNFSSGNGPDVVGVSGMKAGDKSVCLNDWNNVVYSGYVKHPSSWPNTYVGKNGMDGTENIDSNDALEIYETLDLDDYRHVKVHANGDLTVKYNITINTNHIFGFNISYALPYRWTPDESTIKLL